MKALIAYGFGFFAPLVVIAVIVGGFALLVAMFEWYGATNYSQSDAWRGAWLLAAVTILAIVALTAWSASS